MQAKGRTRVAAPRPLPAEADIVAELATWRASPMLNDCPLPELFRRVRLQRPKLSVGQFHDACRRLCERGQLYLHPWTGPLHDMPEPTYALLAGHEVAYYASLRDA